MEENTHDKQDYIDNKDRYLANIPDRLERAIRAILYSEFESGGEGCDLTAVLKDIVQLKDDVASLKFDIKAINKRLDELIPYPGKSEDINNAITLKPDGLFVDKRDMGGGDTGGRSIYGGSAVSQYLPDQTVGS